MTALGKAMADLEVADPEQQRVQEVKKRVRRPITVPQLVQNAVYLL